MELMDLRLNLGRVPVFVCTQLRRQRFTSSYSYRFASNKLIHIVLITQFCNKSDVTFSSTLKQKIIHLFIVIKRRPQSISIYSGGYNPL